MQYTEKIQDLFATGDDYYLAHCISADFGMGAGIVIQFNKRFNMKKKLQQNYLGYLDFYRNLDTPGDCILEGRVFNLITKERYYQKPTLESMENALIVMRDICLEWKEDEAKYRGMIEAYQDALETIDCLVRKESSPILVGLPCNPGDKVYADSHCFGVLEYTVENFVISSDGLTIQCAAHSQSVGDYASECLDEIEADISEFGKTIFLTMEDAVKASSNIYNTNSEVEEEYEKD